MMTTTTNMVPMGLGDREKDPRSMRFPLAIVEEIKAIAEETTQDFSTTAFYLLKKAIEEYRANNPRPVTDNGHEKKPARAGRA